MVILGTGGNALDVLDLVQALNTQGTGWDVIGVLDDAADRSARPFGLPVLGRLEDAARLSAPGGPLAEARFVNAIGSERNHAQRAEILARTGLAPEQFTTLVHPGASVSPRAALGHGCCVGFGACVGGQARIAEQVWIGPGCVVGHDCVLDYAAVMAPRSTISGFVRLGYCCYLGSAAAVRQNISVGSQALVGIGAVVIRDVAPRTVVVGNPARELTSDRRAGSEPQAGTPGQRPG